MDAALSPIQAAVVTASALLAAAIGLLATLRRGQWLTTLLFASSFLSLAAFQAGTLGMLNATTTGAARMWATYLAGVSALASWLWLVLSVVLARPSPILQLRNAAAYLTLALIGCVTLFAVAGTPHVVSGVTGTAGAAVIRLGGMGKVYLMYLVIVMVAVLMNLESMLRTAPASSQRRLRPMFAAFVVGILSNLLVVSAALLYGGLEVRWFAASAVPMFVSGVVTAFALARQRLSDMAIPVARPVIYYSSVSLTLAGAFLLTMAALSKVLPVLSPEWKRTVSLLFYLLVGGGGLVLTFSPRANRGVKRFIDRNFYANRYDYRREWERVSRAITPTARPEDICRQIEILVRAVFEAERVVIHLKDERTGAFHRIYPPSSVRWPEVTPVVAPDSLVVQTLDRLRMPLVFRDLSHDLDLIPVVVENRPLIQAMSAAACAPLHVGEEMVGLMWLSEKRSDDEYSYEDVEFLGAMSRQLAAALWFARLADQLAETRQLESLHRLSTFVLHDIKNQVSGLSLVVENARRHLAQPEFQRDALKVVERTVRNLRELMGHVSGVAKPPAVELEPVHWRRLVDEAVVAAGLTVGERDGVRFDVRCHGQDAVLLDPRQMLRVITNLLVNAREALQGPGEIELEAAVGVPRGAHNGELRLTLSVWDTGQGMTEEFIRESLFRPFATTKIAGLGIGLAQSKAIVEAHGGTIAVESQIGKGTRFEVDVPARSADRAQREAAGGG
ncbi:MAG TPA: XrtA/PEP-CTERM system histidine kinase PrsK [Candidatus Limnocylindria bacterium]|nr:XrtA/PEP-CTERM system histidine kinase PrsK [Candidatus Limnocylindria bacterium]